MRATRLSISCVSLTIGICLFAADQKGDDPKKTAGKDQQRETVAKPLTEKERKRREAKLKKELETPYRKWPNEDVSYIITAEERAAVKRLQTDAEREQSIAQFWLRRDPPPESGEYRMTMDPSEKDALLYVPGAGLTLMEQMGLSNKTDRFSRTDGTHLGVPFGGETQKMNEFNRLEQFAKLQRAPSIKFKDLEAAVNSRISYNILPMKVQVSYFPVTDASVLTYITLQFDNKDLQFQAKEGVQKAVVNIYGRISTMTRRMAVTPFEDTVTVDSPTEFLQDYAKNRSIYQKTVPLNPGTYRLNVVAKDVVGGNLNNYEVAITVPRLDQDKASTSSLVLADMLEAVPSRSIGAGMFVIGSTKVRPRVDDIFKRSEKMAIYMKVYNLGADENTHKPVGEVEYEIVKKGSNEKVASMKEDLGQLPDASGSQVTLQKFLNLNGLDPGQYTVRLKITDKTKNQVLTPSADFTVT